MNRARSFAVVATAVALFLSACTTLPRDYMVSTASGAIAIAIKHCAIDAQDTDQHNDANWTAQLAGGVWSVAYAAPPLASPGLIEVGRITTKIAARDGMASDCTAEMLVGAR